MYGAERLQDDLKALGFEKVHIVQGADSNNYVIILDFEISSGCFQGRVVDIGFLAPPDYPNSVASSINLRSNPHLFDYHQSLPNVRNIIQSQLGSEWRYWSYNFAQHWNGEIGTRRLMSLVQGVFDAA